MTERRALLTIAAASGSDIFVLLASFSPAKLSSRFRIFMSTKLELILNLLIETSEEFPNI